MKRDLERRGAEGAMIKGSKEADPSLSRVRALAQDDSSARRVKKGKGGEVISFLCYAKRSEPVIPSLRSGRALSAAGERHDVIDHVAGPAVGVTALPHEIVLRHLTSTNATRVTDRGTGTGARML